MSFAAAFFALLPRGIVFPASGMEVSIVNETQHESLAALGLKIVADSALPLISRFQYAAS